MEGWKDRKTESHFVYFILGGRYIFSWKTVDIKCNVA